MRIALGTLFKVTERFTTVAAGLAASMVIWTVVRPQGPLEDAATTRAPTPSFTVGERFPQLPGLDIASAPSTVIIWISTSCRYCTESLPLYAALLGKRSLTRVVVLGAEPEDTIRAYLSGHGLLVDGVLSVRRTEVKFRGTPTVLLLDQTSRIRRIWRGMLPSAADEAELLNLVH
jgi:hypothetical protein